MSKRVAVIDLGSNSIRLSIFERTSRLGFFVFATHRIKFRIGSGTYEDNKLISEDLIKECVEIFKEFKELIKKYKAKKIKCVATSALRDALNSKEIIKLVFKKTGINIKCIDGKFEAYLGALSSLNLLDIKNGVTLDIGGGSTELALIKDGKIVDNLSLNIGTIRLKELFANKSLKDINKFIKESIKTIPLSFKNENLIAIGGSLRAISNSIITKSFYPLKQTHGFEYEFKDYEKFILDLINASNLEDFFIKKDRFDSIKEGALIFLNVATFLGIKNVITNGTGIREGIFLKSILKNSISFPKGFNPSIKSLQDRFFYSKDILKNANTLFDLLSTNFKIGKQYKNVLSIAAKLSLIGHSINDYKSAKNTYYLILNALEYKISHKDKVLAACLISLNGKKEINFEFDEFKYLLPDQNTIKWLSIILYVAKNVAIYEKNKINFCLNENNQLEIKNSSSKLLRDSLKKLSKEVIIHHS